MKISLTVVSNPIVAPMTRRLAMPTVLHWGHSSMQSESMQQFQSLLAAWGTPLSWGAAITANIIRRERPMMMIISLAWLFDLLERGRIGNCVSMIGILHWKEEDIPNQRIKRIQEEWNFWTNDKYQESADFLGDVGQILPIMWISDLLG